ncbi:MAG: MFS transporter [Alphaproteobacteria bacterium]
MILCGAFFYCYQFLIRVSPNIMTDELMAAFDIDATMLGTITGAYYIAYASMQIPLGVMMDQWGPRRLLMLAATTCGAACILFAFAESASTAWVGRFLMGMGSACGYLGTLKLGTIWFPPRSFAMVVAVTMLSGTVGASIGGAPLELLLNYLGWQDTLFAVGGAGVLIAAVILVGVPERRSYDGSLDKDQAKSPPLLDGVKRIMKSPQNWMIALYGMLMYVPLAILGDLWGVSFFEHKYGITETIAAIAVTSMFIGISVGSPVIAYLTEKHQTRKSIMKYGSLINLVLFMIIIFVPGVPLWMTYVLMFLTGFFFTSQILCFAAATEIMPIKYSGVVLGFTNMIVMLSGAFFHSIVGSLVNMYWDGTEINNVPQYTAADYTFGLTVIPICLVIAFVMMHFVRETFPQQKES